MPTSQCSDQAAAIVAKAHTKRSLRCLDPLELDVLAVQLAHIKQAQLHVIAGCGYQPAVGTPRGCTDDIWVTLQQDATDAHRLADAD